MNAEFMEQGACRGKDPEIFLPVQGDRGNAAKAICRGCVVVEECLEYGLREPLGVWGGLNHRERMRLASERDAMERLFVNPA